MNNKLRFVLFLLITPVVLLGVGSLAQNNCQLLSAETQLPADTGCMGPYEVSQVEYNSNENFPDGLLINGIEMPVDVWASVSFPSGFPNGPAPLILILHGNSQGTCLGALGNCNHHEGFQYLTDHLASHGFIAVSVNANRINSGDFDRVLDRGYLLLEHLKLWRNWNANTNGEFDDLFAGKVDINQIGLAGHSRGGEAVIAAYNLNKELSSPSSIQAVLSIAPTDKQGLYIENVPYYSIVPACDGDVLDYRGVRFFDRALRLTEANPTPKQVAFVIGANHNYFNTLWGRDGGGCFGITPLEREDQEQLAKRLVNAFFRKFLMEESSLHYVFTGDNLGPATPGVPSWISYEDPIHLDIDRFDSSQAANELGRENSFSGFRNADQCGVDNDIDCSVSLVNETSALRLRWLGRDAVFETQIPQKLQDVSKYTHLSFRVTQNSEDVQVDGLKPEGEPVHFEVRLMDAQGHQATLSTEAFGGASFPIGSNVRDQVSGEFLRRTVLATIRMPLSQFAGLDISSVTQVEFLFAGDTKGSIYLSHLQFSR